MSNIVIAQATKLASVLGISGEGEELVQTLKATAFKGNVSDSQMAALLIVANQYGLSPWTKEIYAFPDKNNGIVPVVGLDGWSRIINNHPQFDGLEFNESDEMTTPPGSQVEAPKWIECVIYRKDRNRPIKVREYLDEVYRAPFKGQNGTINGPWQTHTKRFLRHKAMIQCARLAFGYTGIYDQDEAERITEKDVTPSRQTKNVQVAESARPASVVVDSEARTHLVQQLEDIASNQGIDAYSSLWQGLSKQERQMVGAEEHARLKGIAQQFGVIDADYEEVAA